jgi:hypothetical protein
MPVRKWPRIDETTPSQFSNAEKTTLAHLPHREAAPQQAEAQTQAPLDLGANHVFGPSEMDVVWADHEVALLPWASLHENVFLQSGSPCGFPPMMDWTGTNWAPSLRNPMPAVDGYVSMPLFDNSASVIQPTQTAGEVPSGEAVTITPPATANSPTVDDDTQRAKVGEGRADSHPDVPSVSQQRVVDDLLAYANSPLSMNETRQSRACYWRSMSMRVSEAFHLDDTGPSSTASENMLMRMVDLFMQNFNRLWALFSATSFDPIDLHPLLFLTLTSIGSMYASRQHARFGTMMHERTRQVLADSLLELETTEQDILWLAQARVLTQVTALYFGQKRGFSYAQHLGAVVITQARRMHLFTARRYEMGRDGGSETSTEEELVSWARAESRKRLAYGIFRADAFNSVILNTRPLLASEEISLGLLCSDTVWQIPTDVSAEDRLKAVREDRARQNDIPFCDLVRVVFDRQEVLSEMDQMEPRAYELLLFGLQGLVWRFSHDLCMFVRLTGKRDDRSETGIGDKRCLQQDSRPDQLAIKYRNMSDLREDNGRLLKALDKWHQSFNTVRTTIDFKNDRTSTLSSLILFHISHLRLKAPLDALHYVAYGIADRQPIERRRVQDLSLWTQGQDAVSAVQTSCQIWSVLEQESRRPPGEMARYNLLSILGLHHASVVLWTYASTHDMSGPLQLPATPDRGPIPISRSRIQPLLGSIVDLYRRLSAVGWYSFAAAAERLAGCQFPWKP